MQILQRSRPHTWVAGAGALLLILTGCATVKPEFTDLFWPAPPLTSRIKFEAILRSQDDLGRDAGTLFVEALIGRKERPVSLRQPMAAVPSRDGKRLYVSDYVRGTVFVFDFEEREVSFLGGPARGFSRPFGIAVDQAENVYVVDADQRVIRVFDPNGKFLRNMTHESIERPTGIAIDPDRGRIYVADSASRKSDNHSVHVFDLEGGHIKAIGGTGNANGTFYFPTYLAVDANGNLYVADTLNARVQAFDPEGRYLKTFGERGDGIGMFDKPKGVAVDTFGNVYVVDSTWSNVQIFNQKRQTLLYFAGRGRFPGLLFNPNGISIDKNNRIYVADSFNGRVNIYQLINTTAEDSFLPLPPRPGKGGDAGKAEKEDAGKREKKKEDASKTLKQANSQ